MRWPFAVALVLSVFGAGAALATPHIQHLRQARQEAREEKQAAAQFRREQPAADAVDRMPRPAGVGTCPNVPEGSVARTHMICWRGDVGVETTTIALTKNLRAIGATDASPRCIHRHSTTSGDWVACELSAHIEGQPVVVSLFPVTEKAGFTTRTRGVDVTGDIGENAFPVMTRQGTPLLVPAS